MPDTAQTLLFLYAISPGNRSLCFGVSHQMPQFFFDVRDRDKVFADEEGQELADVGAAEIEAAEAAMAIGRDILPSRHGGELVIEVLNERRERVLMVKVALHIAPHTTIS